MHALPWMDVPGVTVLRPRSGGRGGGRAAPTRPPSAPSHAGGSRGIRRTGTPHWGRAGDQLILMRAIQA